MSKENTDAQAEIQRLRRALEDARHALVMVAGVTATDRPDLFNFDTHPEDHWIIDYRAAIAAIDQALGSASV